jgi:crotonobetainyl-CoA:carnitine CoA-transferase CaiB-like acyl-CoA transferase
MLADAGAHVLLVDRDELATSEGRRSFRRLVEQADVVLEAEPPGRLADLGLDYADLTRLSPDTGEPDNTPGPPAVNARLIQVSITPFGRTSRGPMSMTSRGQPMTDDTIRARAGWLDDSGLPIVPANPTVVAARMAMMATLAALMARERHGSQFVDVSILAAANVCAGPGTAHWLSNGWPLGDTASMRP